MLGCRRHPCPAAQWSAGRVACGGWSLARSDVVGAGGVDPDRPGRRTCVRVGGDSDRTLAGLGRAADHAYHGRRRRAATDGARHRMAARRQRSALRIGRHQRGAVINVGCAWRHVPSASRDSLRRVSGHRRNPCADVHGQSIVCGASQRHRTGWEPPIRHHAPRRRLRPGWVGVPVGGTRCTPYGRAGHDRNRAG